LMINKCFHLLAASWLLRAASPIQQRLLRLAEGKLKNNKINIRRHGL